MKVSYNWLQSFFDKKLPVPEKLADLLTFHSFEVEKVEKQDSDWVLDIDILPNRSHDCLSHQGVAREISALLKYPLKLVDYSKKIKESSESVDDLVKIDVQNSISCPRYMARVVVDIKIGPSPEWIQERLKTCDLRPINSVVDIANYVMLETGQPLHAFDIDKLKGNSKQKTLIIRQAKKGEKVVTLEKEKFELDEKILVIADQEKATCIAGIKGGEDPEIDQKTKRIILESANFNPSVIRYGSKQTGLRTDASWRFENGLDPNLTEEAIDMAAYLIQETANGQVLKGKVDVYPKKRLVKKVNLDTDQARSLLGVKISDKVMSDILKRLGFEVNGKFQVTIPTRRLDISIQEDLIEEIGRIYGFEKIPSKLPQAILIPAERSEDLIYQNKVKDILTNLGFSEVYNYSLIGDKEIESYKIKSKLAELANPVSLEQKYLRSSLMPLLLKNIKSNKRYFERVRLFEIGHVFNLNKKQIKEEKKLAGIISLEEKKGITDEFYRLKGVVDALLNRIGISDIWYDDSEEEQQASIKIGNDLIGWLGEIEPQVAGFEIDFEKLVQLATEERVYATPSKYPAMVRDISIWVDQNVKVAKVLNVINTAGGSLIRDIDLFDMYQRDGKKSLAFHIVFQSNERTLIDKEVNQLQDKIIKALEEENWEVRKQQ